MPFVYLLLADQLHLAKLLVFPTVKVLLTFCFVL